MPGACVKRSGGLGVSRLYVFGALGAANCRGVNPPLIYASHAATYGNESTRMTLAAREAEADAHRMDYQET